LPSAPSLSRLSNEHQPKSTQKDILRATNNGIDGSLHSIASVLSTVLTKLDSDVQVECLYSIGISNAYLPNQDAFLQHTVRLRSNLTKWVVKIPNRIPIRLGLCMRISVTEELVSIVRSVRYLEVFIPWLFQCLEVMQPTPRPNGRHGTVLLAVLKPRATVCRPDESSHERMRMLEEIPDTLRLWAHGFDILALYFVDYLEDVSGVPLDDGEKGGMAGWPVGTQDH
jgi:hypothetical protein